MTLPVLISRACGSCTLCCEVMAVDTLGKPQHQRCAHQGNGCAIYETRPESCRGFSCAWLTDPGLGLSEKDRPELTGIVLSIPEGGMEIHAHLAHERAAETYWGNRLISRLARRHIVKVVWKGEVRRLRGPWN